MNRSFYSNSRRQGSRESLERRMDKWMETGRQLVDGVAGNRPGQRKKENRSGVSGMSRWVGKKIDWFFEEEDNWYEPIDLELEREENIPIKKKPLTAISLRVPKALSPSSEDVDTSLEQPWPDDSTFRIERWERETSSERKFSDYQDSDSSNTSQETTLPRRPLPRSSRRK
ncbi:RNA helicase [Prochlorococcus marinus]|uniref:RNA helicase n=1 Tax=Prochlorococcus marinus TaxID=1219 RepID=UPI0022B2FCBA|nr:RNA helicase [Prochlorococcus marinus]